LSPSWALSLSSENGRKGSRGGSTAEFAATPKILGSDRIVEPVRWTTLRRYANAGTLLNLHRLAKVVEVLSAISDVKMSAGCLTRHEVR